MTQEINEVHLRLAGGQAAAALAPQVTGVRKVLSGLPAPWWATVNFSMPIGDQQATVLFRCQAQPDGSLVDEQGVDADQSFGESLGLGMIHGGTLVVRTELPLRVQRPNDRGQLEWAQQDKLYGFQLWGRDWFPVTEAQMRQAYAFDAQTGRPLTALAGRTFGILRKPKNA